MRVSVLLIINVMKDDTIPVRPDEGFDEDRLAEFLLGELPGTANPLSVRQFGEGAANLTYLLDYGSHQYVLRRPPLGPVAPSSHDMSREYKVLSVIHQAYPLAPQAYLFCDDPAIIGAHFFIMERRRGVVVRRTLPEVFRSIQDAPTRLSEALVDALVDFHAVDYEVLGLGDLGRPTGFIARQIEGWYHRWNHAKTDKIPEMDVVYNWLKGNLPPSTRHTLVHNDYKLDNVMFSPEDPGQVMAVFDWDMCTLGDPLTDLGALLTYWTEPDDLPYMRKIAQGFMPIDDDRFMTRAELVSRYAERSGCDVSHIQFYHALGLFRVAIIIAQIYIRYKRGQTQDQRFAEFGPLVGMMVKAVYEMVN